MPARERGWAYTNTCVEKDVLKLSNSEEAGGQELYLHNTVSDAEQTYS